MVACHKASLIADDDIYRPIFVGSLGKMSPEFKRIMSGERIEALRDDEGQNISSKNYMYSELSGLYWARYNLDVKYLGLVHYRRYFKGSLIEKSADKAYSSRVLSGQEARELMRKYDIVVPKKRNYFIETIYSHYEHTFAGGAQLDCLGELIEKHCPDYKADFDSFVSSRKGHMFNMFLAKKDLIDEYCDWLFPLIDEMAEILGFEGLDDFYKRYPGRASERLFNVWLMHQQRCGLIDKERVGYVKSLYLGQVNWPKKITAFLMAAVFKKKYKKSF